MAWHSVLIYLASPHEWKIIYKGTQNDRTRNLQSDRSSSHMQESNLLIDMLFLLLDGVHTVIFEYFNIKE